MVKGILVCKTRIFALGDKSHSFFAPEGKPPRRGLNTRPLACGHEIKCYSTQFIDEHGAFSADKLDNFIKQGELGECGSSYAVVSIMGPQSSGKSALLNHLFKTNFRKIHAEDGRSDISVYDESSSTTGILEMVMVRDVKAGAEVFNTYGSMGNAALLHRIYKAR
nr:protein root hair defective 3 [Tanacetum cinerariifolium]